MDENGLPITGAGVNYSAVEAINQRELITYLNMFVVRTCAFLNNFATKCESKLADLDSRLESIDTSLTLLETKLDSVEELRNLKLENDSSSTGTSNQSSAQNQTNTNDAVSTGQDSNSAAIPPPPPPPPPPPGAAPDIQQQPQIEQAPVMTISQDPRFKKFFMMLKNGVLEEAVRREMRFRGIDPDLLNNPNAPAPPPDPEEEKDEED